MEKLSTINYPDFYKKLNIYHNNNIKKFSDAHDFSIYSAKYGADGISYDYENKFTIDNNLIDKKKLYYDYELENKIDIINNINFTSNIEDIEFKYNISNIVHSPENIKEFILCAFNGNFKIRIFFDNLPKKPVEIMHISKRYILSPIKKKLINTYAKIINNNCMYSNGYFSIKINFYNYYNKLNIFHVNKYLNRSQSGILLQNMDYTKMNDKPGKTFGLKNSDYCPDGVSWLCKKKFMVNDYILQEYNNKHYIDVNLEIDSFDFINNMKISSKKNNFTYNYYINGTCCNNGGFKKCIYPHTTYLPCNYSSLLVRIFFEELPLKNDVITFSAKNYYLIKTKKDFLDSSNISIGDFSIYGRYSYKNNIS